MEMQRKTPQQPLNWKQGLNLDMIYKIFFNPSIVAVHTRISIYVTLHIL